MEIRNIAVIAHVDHGKTTLVEKILQQNEGNSSNRQRNEQVMDSNDQEQERGITIYSKNASLIYQGSKINLIDTPGHADFGSEVERVLKTVDATVLLVDAYEGPMPQTKFVLQKSLSLGKKVLVVINKIDKPSSRPDFVIDRMFDLFIKLGASDEQLDFPYMYTIAREGVAIRSLEDKRENLLPLLDFLIKEVPVAEQNRDLPGRMQPSTLGYDNFLGRLAIGRMHEGFFKTGQNIYVIDKAGKKRQKKISQVFVFEGVERVATQQISAGDVVVIAGIDDIFVGETIVVGENVEALPAIDIDPPSLAMYFMVNDAPFAGREGKWVTSRQIRNRLLKELETNVGLEIEISESTDSFKVLGRGEMHLAVLLETMRREGFELQISQPEVILKEIDGKVHEPIENAVVTVPEEFCGKVIEMLSMRKGQLKNMSTYETETLLEFEIPSRGLLGVRSDFIVLTRGEGTLSCSFSHMAPYCGAIEKRQVGSLISAEKGIATAFSLWKLQERGNIFITPGTEVYQGMIIGEHNRGSDLWVNPIKGKQLTNIRASGADDAITLIPPLEVTLERSLEYIKEDELAEITPQKVRLRKKYLNQSDAKKFKG